MKKLLGILFLTFPINVFALDYYKVISGYNVGDKFRGELVSVVFDGYDTSLVDEFANGYNVRINKQSETQVRVTFVFTSIAQEENYDIQAEVLIDLDKTVELTFEQDKFYFHIKHLGT